MHPRGTPVNNRRWILFAIVAIVAITFCSAASAQQPDSQELRFWIGRSGNDYLKARLIGVTDRNVLLRDANGRDHEIPLAELSNEDRDHARRHGRQMSSGFGQPRPKVGDRKVDALKVDTLKADAAVEPTSFDQAERLPTPAAEPISPQPKATAAGSNGLPSILKTLSGFVSPTKPDAESVESKDTEDKPLFGPDSSVYVSLSGRFLNEFVQLPIAEEKEVIEVIMGTPIIGNARTRGDVRMLLLPSPDKASFELIARGQANSQTTGRQLVINIHSDGTTQFEAHKRITVDTHGIHLYRATADARTTVNRQAISTELPGILGDVAGRIAHRIVDANRPQIDFEASQRAAARAARELDQTVESEAVRLQRILKRLAPGMTNGEPAVPVQFRTTTERMEILVGENEPKQWQFQQRPPADDEDIVVVLPRKTVDTAQRLKMAMKLLALSVGEQLADVNTDELEPTKRSWSDDGQWLTLVWNVDTPVVRAISEDLLPPTDPALPLPAEPQPAFPYRGRPAPRLGPAAALDLEPLRPRPPVRREPFRRRPRP